MTLFEKILAREVPAEILYEDGKCACIRDIQPQAPVHLLVIPKRPIARLAEAGEEDGPLLGHLLVVASRQAGEAGLGESGFRVVINSGSDGGETVPHLHVHVLGGRAMNWPPG